MTSQNYEKAEIEGRMCKVYDASSHWLGDQDIAPSPSPDNPFVAGKLSLERVPVDPARRTPLIGVMIIITIDGEPERKKSFATKVISIFERDENFSIESVRDFVLANPNTFSAHPHELKLRVCGTWHNQKRFLKWAVNRNSRYWNGLFRFKPRDEGGV